MFSAGILANALDESASSGIAADLQASALLFASQVRAHLSLSFLHRAQRTPRALGLPALCS